MTGKERREQLIGVGRALFAEKGFDGTSIEEIAAKAKVSKPVVYEHFGAKEGIYAVVVDREMQRLLSMVTQSLVDAPPRLKLERAALAMLPVHRGEQRGLPHTGAGLARGLRHRHVRQPDQRDRPPGRGRARRGVPPRTATTRSYAPMYAQMLVGMVALTGQWWLDVRKPPREEVAAHLVNLAWNGLNRLDPNPKISEESRGLVITPPVTTHHRRAPLSEKERRASRSKARGAADQGAGEGPGTPAQGAGEAAPRAGEGPRPPGARPGEARRAEGEGRGPGAARPYPSPRRRRDE